jgi:uncharacterized protein YcfJ
MAKVNETAKRVLRSAASMVSTKQGQYRIAGTGIGAAVAGIVGMGSIGVATGLGAFALPGIVLLAIPGLIIGNRVGVEMEKRDLRKRLEAESASSAPSVGPTIKL